MFRKRPVAQASRRSPSNPLPRSAYSYYNARITGGEANKNRSTAKDSRQAEDKHRHRWSQIPIIAAVIVIVLCVLYELGLNTNPKVVILDKNSSAATFLQPSEIYERAAHKLLEGSISSRTKLTINTGAITSRMTSQFPELAHVTITLPLLGQRPVLYLEASEPALVLNSASGSFLLDAGGKVLTANAGTISDLDKSLPTIDDQTSLSIQPGHLALAQSDAGFVQLIMSQFEKQGIKIQSLVLPASTRELDVHLSGQTYFVKFNLNDSADAKQQVGTFLATRQYLASHNITPSAYIDARIPGRVYYK